MTTETGWGAARVLAKELGHKDSILREAVTLLEQLQKLEIRDVDDKVVILRPIHYKLIGSVVGKAKQALDDLGPLYGEADEQDEITSS